MEPETVRAAAVGVVAGLAAYYAYLHTDVLSAMVVLFTTAWIVYRFSTAENAWNTLGMLLNPFMAAIIFFLVGFSYSAITGKDILVSLGLGTLSLVFGILFGQIVYKYWNIGS